MQRQANSRKKPPKHDPIITTEKLNDYNLTPIPPVKLINSKTDLIEVLNRADSMDSIRTKTVNGKEIVRKIKMGHAYQREFKNLKPMALFPPYFDLNSNPKCPNFNCLRRILESLQ